jgi:hypothetical protein
LRKGPSEAASAAHGWLAFGGVLLACAIAPVVCTVVLARKGRLFLRDADSIDRNRERITRFAIPVGWVLGGALVITSLVSPGYVLPTALAGLALGFWPGILANFLRLRRERWSG